MKSRRLLIVDDEPGIRTTLAAVLEDEEYTVEAVANGEECLALLERQAFDCVLLDVWLPGMDGMEVLNRIHERVGDERPAVVMISGHGNIETALRATRMGAFDFIEKPLTIDKVLVVVKNAIEQRRMALELDRLGAGERAAYPIVGDSVPMKALRQQLGLMAATNGRVLIYGESGTGKELVAHAIHAMSLRAQEAFVEVNCAAIPDDLIESELFGH